MNSSPAVSVLMTVFNRAPFIAQAIESVLASTFADFELLIVDDRSSDESVGIAREYAKRDSRIRVFVNEKNVGDYPNRNLAAGKARGTLLKYLDADDYLYPAGLATLVETMKQFPSAGYGLCSLDQDKARPFPFQLTSREAYVRHYFQAALFHKAPLSSIIRKDAFNAVGGFSGKRMIGDMEMWHRLSARFPVVLMGGGIVWYRIHDAQESRFYRDDPTAGISLRWQVTREALASPECPLTANEVSTVSHRLFKRKLELAVIKAVRARPRELAGVLRLKTAITPKAAE